MDAQIFWNIIGIYNRSTWLIQILLFIALVLCVVMAYQQKTVFLPKFILGIINLFIGICFFGYYGTEAIQKHFALPLFVAIGVLFLWESVKHRNDSFLRFNEIQLSLLGLVVLYPLVSLLLGHKFPQIVVYIMPCPMISLSIILYSCYKHKNKVLLLLLTLWGLTGVKAFIVNAFEDTILLICGIYCLFLFIHHVGKGRLISIGKK